MATGQRGGLTLTLTYCAPCGYTERALQTAQDILSQREMEYFLDDFHLIPGSGGVFEVEIDGQTLYSKKETGRHAEPGEVKRLLGEYLKSYSEEHGIILPLFESD